MNHAPLILKKQLQSRLHTRSFGKNAHRRHVQRQPQKLPPRQPRRSHGLELKWIKTLVFHSDYEATEGVRAVGGGEFVG